MDWFFGTPSLSHRRLRPVETNWHCPTVGCAGLMVFNGELWPTGTPGYHHTCSMCGLTLALSGKKYPAIEYEEA